MNYISKIFLENPKKRMTEIIHNQEVGHVDTTEASLSGKNKKRKRLKKWKKEKKNTINNKNKKKIIKKKKYNLLNFVVIFFKKRFQIFQFWILIKQFVFRKIIKWRFTKIIFGIRIKALLEKKFNYFDWQSVKTVFASKMQNSLKIIIHLVYIFESFFKYFSEFLFGFFQIESKKSHICLSTFLYYLFFLIRKCFHKKKPDKKINNKSFSNLFLKLTSAPFILFMKKKKEY